MAAGINGVLRGIQGELKNAILSLSEEGWTPSKTNGGHIRLDHPDATRPVFTASTPSDYRTPANLRRDCRGALRARPPCETDPISEEEAMRSLKRHKAARKTKRRTPNPLDTAAKRVVEQFRAEASGQDPAPAAAKDRAPPKPAPLMPPKAAADPQDHPEPRMETAQMNMIADVTRAEPAPVKAPEPMKPSAAAKPASSKKPPVPAKSVAARPASAPAAPPAPAEGLSVASDEVALGIRIGKRLASGELKQVEITPDMVGKTLILGAGEVYWLDADPGAAAPVAKRGGYRKNERFNVAILAFLEELKGEEVPVSMIADHMAEKGFYKTRSARQGVLRRLAQLRDDGRVTFFEGQGEPCATLPSQDA